MRHGPTARQPLVAAGPEGYLPHNCGVCHQCWWLLLRGAERCWGSHRLQEWHEQPKVVLAWRKSSLLALVALAWTANWILLVYPCSVRCAVISVAEGWLRYSYHCGVMEGRFVHVSLPGLQKSLTICQVIVYGVMLGKCRTHQTEISLN